MSPERKKKIIKKFQMHKGDNGSPQVQVAILTRRIEDLSKHLLKHKQDIHSRRGLLHLVGQRRTLLRYLEKKDLKVYKKVKKDLKLK